MKKRNVTKQFWFIILIFASLLLYGCHQHTSAKDSDFTDFMQNNSDFFTIARTVIPWEEEIPSGANTVYLHKCMGDGREYAEIKILYSDQNSTEVRENAEHQAKSFAQAHLDKAPYFCVEEAPFQIGKTVFQCYTFSVSKSNQSPASYYGFAIGYNEEENSVVFLFFSDEALSYSEPDYLLSQFYP